jgi:hypothetical protein
MTGGPAMQDAAEMLWVVLANVSGGDWSKQTPEWQEAAARWRDNYFAALTGTSALADAATALYMAGRWSAPGVSDVEAARLWTALRDAVGLPEGTATTAGIGTIPA